MSVKTAKLQNELTELQKSGRVVLAELRTSNLKLYKHLVTLLFWWLDAKKIDGFLEKEYKTIGLKRAPQAVDYGVNFSPLLKLAYGYNRLTDERIDVYRRALNKALKQFQNNPKLYKSDHINKLANFIDNTEGGLSKLSGYKKDKSNKLDVPNEVVSTEAASSNDAVDGAITTPVAVVVNNVAVNIKENKELRRKILLQLADGLYIHGESDEIKLSAYIKNSPQNFRLTLAYHDESGIKHIETQYNQQIVEDMLASIMSKRFEVAVQSVRPLFELIYTQCLPNSTANLADRLTDKTTIQDVGKRKQTFTSHRRVMYRYETNEFILSPMNALTGVVSVVKPFFGLILADCTTDVYMPVSEREELEDELLRNYEFNLYNAEHPTLPIPQYPELDSASHVVHLRHRTKPNHFSNVSFWPFYNTLEQPQDQLVIDTEYVFTPTWHAHINRNEIKRVYYEFVEFWLDAKNDRYIARTSGTHDEVKVTFNENAWQFEFTFINGKFERNETVPINTVDTSNQSVSAIFKMKDFMPVFKSLADLPICDVLKQNLSQLYSEVFDDGDDGVEENDENDTDFLSFTPFIPDEATNYKGGIMFELNDDLLRIEFSTYVSGGSEHTIYIPTVDVDGNRSTKPFKRYFPLITVDKNASNTMAGAL
jgi:hypothetical protein